MRAPLPCPHYLSIYLSIAVLPYSAPLYLSFLFFASFFSFAQKGGRSKPVPRSEALCIAMLRAWRSSSVPARRMFSLGLGIAYTAPGEARYLLEVRQSAVKRYLPTGMGVPSARYDQIHPVCGYDGERQPLWRGAEAGLPVLRPPPRPDGAPGRQNPGSEPAPSEWAWTK